ncbi:MAG: hypothetical protein JW940_07525 [Polyangiaceae bacterium]|nr:hypothetical protein [Polyangiaceae bacterium]
MLRRLAGAGLVTVLATMSPACKSEDDSSHGAAGTPGSGPSEGGAAGRGTAGEPGSAVQGGAAGAEAGNATAGEPGSFIQGGAAGSDTARAGTTSVAGSSGSHDCGDIDAKGVCSGDLLEYCANGEVATLDCALIGATCSVADGEATCTALERAMPCGKLTNLGTCDGATMRYCDETGTVGVARVINCAAYGQQCDPTAGNDGGADCKDYGDCPNGVDEDGICNDNELRFCEGGQLYVFDCGMDECRSADGFADCFAPDFEDGCADVPVEGTCDGQTLSRCLGNVVTREDCATLGLACVEGDEGASCQRTDCPVNCVSGYECTDGLCVPETEPERDWTVALYSVANNSLSDALWRDLNEIEAVGSNADVQVVAQIEFSETYSGAVPEEYRTGAYRMAVQRDDDSSSSASLDSATDLGDDVDMGSEATLTSFLRWAAQNYPARRMALVLANHGGGYQGGFYDEGDDDAMSLRDMVDGVRESGVHLDMVAMDACMMGMHEVGMAFRGVADVLVASPDLEPGGGYPYTPIMTALQDDSGMTAAELGEQIVDEYTAEYQQSSKSRPVTIGVTDLQTLPVLNERLAGFTQTVLTEAAGMRSAIRNAVASTDLMRAESIPSITDIGSILREFSKLDGPIKASADEVNAWFEQSGPVLSKGGTEPKEGTSGLGIYFPEAAWTHSTGYSSYWTSTSFLPLQPWFAFVGNLSTGEEEVVTPGEGAVDSFSVVLTWGSEPNGNESSADLDLYVYEPNGEFGTPANGKATTNGMLSGDSYDTEIARESYELKPEHQAGTYLVLVNLYWIEKGEQAYPRLLIYRNDVPGGVRTLIRGKVVDRELQEIPMDDSNLLAETINDDNLQDVLELEYSNLWYATTIEVSADSEEASDEG